MGWFSPSQERFQETIFYDGDCGLCHGFVKFVLARDGGEKGFLFAPLQGESFKSLNLTGPFFEETMIVQTVDSTFLSRSTAALHILHRLGDFWKIVACVGKIVPRRLRDWVYNCVAAVRKKLFRTPEGLCPILPEKLRPRFLL